MAQEGSFEEILQRLGASPDIALLIKLLVDQVRALQRQNAELTAALQRGDSGRTSLAALAQPPTPARHTLRLPTEETRSSPRPQAASSQTPPSRSGGERAAAPGPTSRAASSPPPRPAAASAPPQPAGPDYWYAAVAREFGAKLSGEGNSKDATAAPTTARSGSAPTSSRSQPGAAPSDATSPTPAETLELLAGPFGGFSAALQFRKALESMAGVTRVQVKEFRNGSIAAEVACQDAAGFPTMLEAVPGYRVRILESEATYIKVEVQGDGEKQPEGTPTQILGREEWTRRRPPAPRPESSGSAPTPIRPRQ